MGHKTNTIMNNYFYSLLALAPFLFNSCSSTELNHPASQKEPTYYMNKSDSIAVIGMYQKLNLNLRWDLNDFKTWSGVEGALDTSSNEYRVTGFVCCNGVEGTEFPEELRQLTELRKLYLGGGSFSGEIPHWIGELKNLEQLSLGSNNLKGKLPDEIGNLTNLTYLNITQCNLTGELPQTIGNLNKLIRLNICYTQVTGTIPSTLSYLKDVLVIDLSNNRLSGKFPVEAITNKRVYFDCSNNDIDELSWEVWEDKYIGSIPDLRENKLKGATPEDVKKLRNWESYNYLVSNQKNGYGYE